MRSTTLLYEKRKHDKSFSVHLLHDMLLHTSSHSIFRVRPGDMGYSLGVETDHLNGGAPCRAEPYEQWNCHLDVLFS